VRKKVATNAKQASWNGIEDDGGNRSENEGTATKDAETNYNTNSDYSDDEELQGKRKYTGQSSTSRKKSCSVSGATKRKGRTKANSTEQWCTRHEKRRTSRHFSETLQKALWRKGEHAWVPSALLLLLDSCLLQRNG
jgi:hypothetical protein